MLPGLKVSSLASKFVIYRPEHIQREGQMKFVGLEMQK